MAMLNVLLVICGIVLSIVTTALVFFLWKYLRLKKEQSKHKEPSPKQFPYSTSYVKVPIFTKTMPAQMPTTKAKSTIVVPDDSTENKNESLENRKREESNPQSLKAKQTRKLSQSVEDLRAAERRNSQSMSAALMRKKFGTLPREESFDIEVVSPEVRLLMTKQMVINQRMLKDLRQQTNDTPRSRRRGSAQAAMSPSDLRVNRVLSHNLDFYEDSDNGSIYSGFTESEINLEDSFNSGTQKRRLGITRNSSIAAKKSAYRKTGKIIFSTEYSEDQKTFRIHVQQAMNLAPRREESDVCTFVRLYLEPGKKQKQQTRVIRGTKEPVYEEMFKFINLEMSEFGHYKLKFKVYNSAILKNELLGEATLFLSSLDTTMKETFSLDLLLRKSEVCKSSVMISLCHQGTFSKLEVIVHEAKRLPKKQSTPNLNPYVVVSLYKDDTVETKETVYQLNDRNPVFNESFDFSVQTDLATPLSTYSLVVSVVHKSLVRKDWIIGHVIYGLTSPQESAKEQWKTVQAEPHRRHSEWHYLLDPSDL